MANLQLQEVGHACVMFCDCRPTQTMALLFLSPAIDGGNRGGCRDWLGHLLKTDQRGMPRPDQGDSRGCDIGAYERQSQ